MEKQMNIHFLFYNQIAMAFLNVIWGKNEQVKFIENIMPRQ